MQESEKRASSEPKHHDDNPDMYPAGTSPISTVVTFTVSPQPGMMALTGRC